MKYLMNPTAEQIKEIADSLEMGFRCFYNLKTGEIRTLLDSDSWAGFEEEWAGVAQVLDSNKEDYFEFSRYESFEDFRVMADFAYSVDDLTLGERLTEALERPKPFANFKWVIDNSGPYRQQWFDYKSSRYVEYVREQIAFYNQKNEEDLEEE